MKKEKKGKLKKGKSSNGFVYKKRSKEKWHEKATERSGSYDRIVADNVEQYRPRDGTNRIRILPPTWGEPDSFGFLMFVHYSVGPDEQSYLCNRQMKEEECSVCEESARLIKEGEKDDGKKMSSKKRYGVWLLDRKDQDKGPQFWAMPFGTHKEICLAAEDEDGDVLHCDHPDEGYDVIFTKEGALQRTKYTGVKLSRKPSPISEDEDEQKNIMKVVTKQPIPDILKYYPPEYIENIFSGASSRDDDDEDKEDEDQENEEENEEDEDDEDEDEEGDSEDDDEEEDSDEAEEEEDDEEDDDEDVKPKKKKGKESVVTKKLKAAAKKAKKKKK